MELQLVLRDFTAQFVSLEQYQQLMFILGQPLHNAHGISCKEVLTLFQNFPTHTEDNFKDKLHQLQFPYVYNEDKTLAENRRKFQDFFSCLTNIGCAVVEGGHRCEAASRTLQGYLLEDSIPLKQTHIDVPKNNTLYKPIQTQMYYCQDDNKKLDGAVLKYLQKISAKISEQKVLIIHNSWDTFLIVF